MKRILLIFTFFPFCFLSFSQNIDTLAGTGAAGYSGDGGPANLAKIDQPRGIDCDAIGNVYFGDLTNNIIRKVNSPGSISTIIGEDFYGYSNGGGPANAAPIS